MFHEYAYFFMNTFGKWSVLILNNFNKLEPIFNNYVHISRIFFLQISNYIFLLNLLWTYFTVQYLTMA